MERTDQHDKQPTPVIADHGATVAELHQRAAADYAHQQSRRLSREDRVNGNLTGGAA